MEISWYNGGIRTGKRKGDDFMRRWVTGFFMCWGMFLSIPCPCRWWDEKARKHMLACLPLVGGIVGGLWALLAWALGKLQCPAPVAALLLAAFPWLTTGFLHLDGYMDVCDAVLSRRDLATRQKILKDSHCGAFAVICLGLLMLTQWSFFLSAKGLPLAALALTPVAVRAAAGLAVLTLRPMGTSQYAAMGRGSAGFAAFLGVILLLTVALPPVFWGLQGLAPLGAAVFYTLAALWGDRNLGGMSGDISGFALTLGELAGAAVAIFVR